MHSSEAIDSAVEAYDALDEKEKANVTNKDVLDKAVKEYNRQHDLIQDAQDAISAIGTVEMKSGQAISKARKAFEKAVEYDLDGWLDSYEQRLLQAEKEHEELKRSFVEQADQFGETLADMILKGNHSKAETMFKLNINYLSEEEDRRTVCNACIQALCDNVQDAFENKEYMTAMEGLYHHTIFDKYCDEDMKTQVEKLQDSMEKELNRNTPKNGEILDRTSKPGRNTLTVKAGAYDVCVKLELENDPSNYVMFYIKAGKSAKVNILNGRYIAKITEGPVWYGQEQMFGPNATYYRDPEVMETAGYTSSDAIHWSAWTYTINTKAGEWGYQNIDPSDF